MIANYKVTDLASLSNVGVDEHKVAFSWMRDDSVVVHVANDISDAGLDVEKILVSHDVVLDCFRQKFYKKNFFER